MNVYLRPYSIPQSIDLFLVSVPQYDLEFIRNLLIDAGDGEIYFHCDNTLRFGKAYKLAIRIFTIDDIHLPIDDARLIDLPKAKKGECTSLRLLKSIPLALNLIVEWHQLSLARLSSDTSGAMRRLSRTLSPFIENLKTHKQVKASKWLQDEGDLSLATEAVQEFKRCHRGAKLQAGCKQLLDYLAE